MVVEVSSPSTRRTDLVRKRRVYERERCARLTTPLLDGLDLDVDALLGPAEGVDAGTSGG